MTNFDLLSYVWKKYFSKMKWSSFVKTASKNEEFSKKIDECIENDPCIKSYIKVSNYYQRYYEDYKKNFNDNKKNYLPLVPMEGPIKSAYKDTVEKVAWFPQLEYGSSGELFEVELKKIVSDKEDILHVRKKY